MNANKGKARMYKIVIKWCGLNHITKLELPLCQMNYVDAKQNVNNLNPKTRLSSWYKKSCSKRKRW